LSSLFRFDYLCNNDIQLSILKMYNSETDLNKILLDADTLARTYNLKLTRITQEYLTIQSKPKSKPKFDKDMKQFQFHKPIIQQFKPKLKEWR